MLDYPWPRVVGTVVFKAVGGIWEIVRLGEWKWGAWSFLSFVAGLPRALRLRRPTSRDTLRRVDLVKFRCVTDPEDLEAEPAPSLAARLRWYTTVWRMRQRFRSGSESDREDRGVSTFLLSPPDATSRSPGTNALDSLPSDVE